MTGVDTQGNILKKFAMESFNKIEIFVSVGLFIVHNYSSHLSSSNNLVVEKKLIKYFSLTLNNRVK